MKSRTSGIQASWRSSLLITIFWVIKIHFLFRSPNTGNPSSYTGSNLNQCGQLEPTNVQGFDHQMNFDSDFVDAPALIPLMDSSAYDHLQSWPLINQPHQLLDHQIVLKQEDNFMFSSGKCQFNLVPNLLMIYPLSKGMQVLHFFRPQRQCRDRYAFHLNQNITVQGLVLSHVSVLGFMHRIHRLGITMVLVWSKATQLVSLVTLPAFNLGIPNIFCNLCFQKLDWWWWWSEEGDGGVEGGREGGGGRGWLGRWIFFFPFLNVLSGTRS